jgi:shikimate kinase
MSTDGVDESHVKVWLILGPSGVGKSDFGGWLHTELNWLHLEIDRSDGDGIDLNALRPEWDAFLKQNNAQPFRTRLEHAKISAALTFASNFVLNVDQIAAAKQAGIETVYLYGSAAHCIDRFLSREHETGRNLTVEHWLHNNERQYMEISKPAFARYRVHVFAHTGDRLQHREVFETILKNKSNAGRCRH